MRRVASSIMVACVMMSTTSVNAGSLRAGGRYLETQVSSFMMTHVIMDAYK